MTSPEHNGNPGSPSPQDRLKEAATELRVWSRRLDGDGVWAAPSLQLHLVAEALEGVAEAHTPKPGWYGCDQCATTGTCDEVLRWDALVAALIGAAP